MNYLVAQRKNCQSLYHPKLRLNCFREPDKNMIMNTQTNDDGMELSVRNFLLG